VFDPVSLITGGIGLIGSLFGSDEKKTTETSESTSTSSIDYKAMVDAATAAGFNPLTAIRTGGASGFVTTNTKSKGESTTSGSGPNWGGVAEAAGQIAGGLFSGMNNAADPIRAKSTKTRAGRDSAALVDSQLRGALKRPAGSLYSPATGSGVRVSSNAPSLKNQAKGSGAKKEFFGPEMPVHLKLDKPVSLFVTAYDDNGKAHRIANPDLPDADQLIVPTIGIVSSEAMDAATSRGPYEFWNWWGTPPGPSKPATRGRNGLPIQ